MAENGLRDYVLEQLSALDGVRAKAMFGGQGLYLGDDFFGIIAYGGVYLRTDDESRRAFVERGMNAFQPPNRPRGPRTVERYFEVPADILEDPDEFAAWTLRAAKVARAQTSARGRRQR